MMAVAEVSWEDEDGVTSRAPATMEDTSISGACVRVKTPLIVGSKLTVKWHREQFSGVVRNCRNDGNGFLLGILRDQPRGATQARLPAEEKPSGQATTSRPEPAPPASVAATEHRAVSSASDSNNHPQSSPSPAFRAEPPAQPPTPSSSPPRHERKLMRSSKLFSGFWGPKGNPDAPDNDTPTEVSVNKTQTHPAESVAVPQGNLLSCEDIYHASGILSARSSYGIHKIVDMLNSKHIRDLSKEVKRASVLMALDAVGTTVEEVTQDATRRQHALEAYETGQLKQFEQFEERMAKENAQLQAEMERVTAHYAERIKHNLDQVAEEKDALRHWQTMNQQECQRISEAVELCSKPTAPEAPKDASSVLAASVASAGSA